MPTLMDALTGMQAETAAGAAGGQTASTIAGTGTSSATSRLGQLLSAKAGAAGSPTSTQENLAESAAGAETKQTAQLEAAKTGADVQAQKVQEQAQQTQIQQAKTQESQAMDAQKQQFGAQAAATLAQLKAGEDQLALQKNQQAAEALGFQLRLSSEEYTTRLAQEAEKRRLDDGASFQEELYKSTLGGSLDVLKQKLGSEAVMAQDASTFQTQLAKLNMSDWLTMAQYEAKSASAAGMFSGLGGVASAAAALGSSGGGGSTAAEPGQPVYSDAGTGGSIPSTSAQNPAGYGTGAPSVSSGTGGIYTPSSQNAPYTPPGGAMNTNDGDYKVAQAEPMA